MILGMAMAFSIKLKYYQTASHATEELFMKERVDVANVNVVLI